MLEKLREARRNNTAGGQIGMLLLHVVAVMYMLYSGYHGINATATYHAANGVGLFLGVIGIIGVEVALFGLYLAAMKHKIVGTRMQIAAGITAAIGFTFTGMSVIGDSQLQAGFQPPSWLNFYLLFLLPVAPLVMALGATATHWFSPEASRKRKEAEQREADAEDENDMTLKIREAERDAEFATRQVELDTKLALAGQLNEYAKSAEVQVAIAATVRDKGPGILRAAGLTILPGHAPAPPDYRLALPLDDVSQNTHTPSGHDNAVSGPVAEQGEGDKPNGKTRPNPMWRLSGRK